MWEQEERRELEDRRRETPWHLEKSLNLGHLITTASIVASLFFWGAQMDKRVSMLEEQRTAQSRTNDAHEATDRELRQALKEGLETINNKLDKILFERRK